MDEKRSVFIPMLMKDNVNECSNYCTIVLISHANNVILEIFQARHQQYMSQELSGVQLDLEKAEE